VLCHHEVFNPNGIFYALDRRDGALDLGTIEDRDRHPLQFLDKIWRHTLGFACVGFKMTRGQDERVLQAVLDDPSIRKIVLHRENVIRTYVSEEIAKRTGRWEAYHRSELAENPPQVHIEIGDLENHLKANEAFYDGIEQSLLLSHQKPLKLWYEQLFAPQSHSRLLTFLDVAPEPLAAKSVRQNPGQLSELISNYRELETAFAGSKFELLLNAEENRAHGRGLQQN
jgi:LPS sulfotransferase NodH